MVRRTDKDLVTRARNRIAKSSKLLINSQKRISAAQDTVATSQKCISDSQYLVVLTITIVIAEFIASTLKKLSIENETDTFLPQLLPENLEDKPFLTPAENMRQIMTHPFKTGHCPNCGYQFLEAKSRLENWNCPECGWLDDLFE